MRTPEVPAQPVEVNPFWSDGAQREARGSGSQHGGGQGTPTHAEQRLVAHDGLSHQDLLEIEAMSEVQDKLKNEMAEEREPLCLGMEVGVHTELQMGMGQANV
jgi:hypothetical protein